MRVPPIALYSGTAMSTRRFSASITPCSVPPRFDVDHRIAVEHEDVAGRHHVRLAEEHHHVAVGVRRRLVHDLDRLAGDEQRLLGGARTRRSATAPPARGCRRRADWPAACRCVLVRVDARALPEERVHGRPRRRRERLRCRRRDRDRPTC